MPDINDLLNQAHQQIKRTQRSVSCVRRDPIVCLKTECEHFLGYSMPCTKVHFMCKNPTDLNSGFCVRCKNMQAMPKDCEYVTEMAVCQE